jgi:hypothetical protein
MNLRVGMNVKNQVGKIRRIIHQKSLKRFLEQAAGTFPLFVQRHGITCKKQPELFTDGVFVLSLGTKGITFLKR